MQFTVPGTAVLSGLAMSPRGDRMAVAYQRRTAGNAPVTDIMVFIMAGPGPSRTWTGTGSVTGLSWTADEKELEFTWQAGRSGQPVTARVLDLGSSGGSLLGHSRVAATLAGPGRRRRMPGRLDHHPGRDHRRLPRARPRFPRVLRPDRKLLRVLGQAAGWRAWTLLWSDASGRVLIGGMHGPDGLPRVGIISGSTFTPLNATVNATSPTYGAW